MTRSYILISCDCEACIVANTKAVRIAGTKKHPGEELHGTDATKFLRAQQGQAERVGEIGERLRAQFLRGQQ